MITIKTYLEKMTKEELRDLAYYLNMHKVSSLRKSELLDEVCRTMLSPDCMYNRLCVLDDKEIKLFERGLAEDVALSKSEYNIAATISETHYAIVGELKGKNYLIVPADVRKVWERVNGSSFNAYRKKVSWIHKCLFWCEEMYGITPAEKFLEVINIKKGIQIDKAELMDIFHHMPGDLLWSVETHGMFIAERYLDYPEEINILNKAQGGKPYYIPTVEEVEELNDTCALMSGKSYMDLRHFLTDTLHMDDFTAYDTVHHLWNKISFEDDFHGTIEWFTSQISFASRKQVETAIGFFMEIQNSTRMLYNRGYTPSEIRKVIPPVPGQMPTIVAGSSQAASMLAQAAPEIKKMGFNLDLESNATTVPAFAFPKGMNGEMKVAEKKIYPNDPCPCGSGKKYKKCCGKNK